MSKLRTISIDPQFLSISKKKHTVKNNTPLSEVKLNSNNIRELLLEKLRQHKKGKKTQKSPMVQLNTMEEQIKVEENVIKLPEIKVESPEIKNNFNKEIQKIENTIIGNDKPTGNDKPYGNLKNGIKPTFKTWNNTSNEPISNEPISSEPIKEPTINETINSEPEEIKPIIEEIEVKKTFQLGRNKKARTVSVLIKNNSTPKKVESERLNYKKTNLSTIKNYLKKQQLIKFGSTAPNQLLRDMYENSKLCCEIINENPQVIVHNFKEE
jgi:hypothetical protein